MAKWPRNSGSPALSASWAAAFADASLHPQGARTERLAPVQSSGLGARLRMDRLLNDLSFGRWQGMSLKIRVIGHLPTTSIRQTMTARATVVVSRMPR
jgi:hypothetical protein